jgi:hypothetical protein
MQGFLFCVLVRDFLEGGHTRIEDSPARPGGLEGDAIALALFAGWMKTWIWVAWKARA